MFWYLVFLINMMIYCFCFLFDMGYCCVDQAVLPALVYIPGPQTQGFILVNQVLLLIYVP